MLCVVCKSQSGLSHLCFTCARAREPRTAAGSSALSAEALIVHADRAWRWLGGVGPRPPVTVREMTNVANTPDGYYMSNPNRVFVSKRIQSPGVVIETIWHEMAHGRIRELVAFLERDVDPDWKHSLLRPLDESVAYFIGRCARLIWDPSLQGRLKALVQIFLAPLDAYGSMATNREVCVWVPHAVAYVVALVYLEYLIRHTATSQLNDSRR